MTTARPLPAAGEHAPLTVLNPYPAGIRTMTACSCEWVPGRGPASSRSMHTAHQAHRRSKRLPPADYRRAVFGEGPWAGWTWDEWYAAHGGEGLDPYTGARREF